MSKMPPENIIYPVFLPHAGCPFQCVYCNQHAVASEPVCCDTAPVVRVDTALREYGAQVKKTGRAGEIAFYGGTFTALPHGVMESILTMATGYVRDGVFTGIRFSTRPDCLGTDVCRLLSNFPVRTVELGVQSFSDAVLVESGRGYNVAVAVKAAERARRHGWKLGIQLMAGLPGDSAAAFHGSIQRGIELAPDFFRIYPTLVLNGTRLADLLRTGKYRPLDLEEAVGWVVPAYDLTIRAGIPVIRMGLHSDPALREPGVILAGPYHPAFGYIVRCRWWRDLIDKELAVSPPPADTVLALRVAGRHISELVGPGRSNIAHWISRWKLRTVRVVAARGIGRFQVEIEREQSAE